MDFSGITIAEAIWAAVGLVVLGLGAGPLRAWFARKEENEWLNFVKGIIADVVEAAHQAIKGGQSDGEANQVAVNKAIGALTSRKSPKKILKLTGMPVEEFARMEVEAGVSRTKQTALRKKAA